MALGLGGACSATPEADLPGPELLDEAGFEVVATITVDEDGFHGDGITIRSGEAVELMNEGEEEHGFRSGTDFDTGPLLPGERSVLRLTAPDDYEFVDPETGAEGTLRVEADPDADAGD